MTSRRYPERPIVGIGAIVIDGDSVLLVERGREPLKGYWSIPGGVLEIGESLKDGLRREVLEETGLLVDVLEVVEVFERILRDASGAPEYHYVLIDYLCVATGGEMRPGDDVIGVRWAPRAELGDYKITEGTLPVIEKAFLSFRRSP